MFRLLIILLIASLSIINNSYYVACELSVEECTAECGVNAHCVIIDVANTDDDNSNYQCACNEGYDREDLICNDINECLTNNGGCDMHVQCINSNGSFTCGDCPVGFFKEDGICNALCGNSRCEPELEENCVTCHLDCKNATCGVCGDGACEAVFNETCDSCYADCMENCAYVRCDGEPECSGNGTCEYGVCQCFGNYSGPICDIFNEPVNALVNAREPTTKLYGSEYEFWVSMLSIQEVNTDGESISFLSLDGREFSMVTDNTPTTQSWIFNTMLDNHANVSVIIKYFLAITNYTFAEKTVSYPANTLKFNIQLQEWPFKSIDHSLVLVLEGKSGNIGEVPVVESKVDHSGSLQWLTVTVDGVAMFSQFSNEAVVDGRSRIISFHANSDGTVSATIPYFWKEAEIDPSYSVIDEVTHHTPSPSSSQEYNTDTPVNPYVAYIAAFGVLGVIGVAACVAWPKLRKARRLASAQRSTV